MKLLKWFCLFINISWTTAVGNGSLPDYITEEEFEHIDKAGLSIKISNSSALLLPSINESSLVTRPGFGLDFRLWPNGVVPYTIDSTFSAPQRNEIALAIKQFHDNTCIRFVPRSWTHLSWLEILQDESVVGAETDRCRGLGSRKARFQASFIAAGYIVHQLGHTLCMGDEETRRDRDKWIGFNEVACTPSPIDGLDYPRGLNKLYDYLSVMHHELPGFIGCFVAKQPGIIRYGSGGVLSVLDIEILNEVYKCNEGCMGLRFVNIQNFAALRDLVPTGNDLDGSILYTCRAYHQGQIASGKFKLATKECLVPWGGGEFLKTEDVEVLTNPYKVDLQFVANTGSVPSNAVKSGRTNTRLNLYLVRCQYTLAGKTGWIPGKFDSSGAGAFIGYGGKEIKSDTCEFLTCK